MDKGSWGVASGDAEGAERSGVRRWYAATLFVAVALAQQSGKVDSCGGLHATIHDCHCSERVARVRALDIATCEHKRGTKDYDACVKHALAGHSHCQIAERSTDWDRDGDGLYPQNLHGDDVKSPLGSYCKRSCERHRCECAEEAQCDFN